MRIQRGGQGVGTSPPPQKNYKNIWFSSNTGPNPLKNHSYQAIIQCWAIIGTPAKRHLMAFCWRADDCPFIVVLGSSPPSSTENKKKDVRVGPQLTKLSGSAHETCFLHYDVVHSFIGVQFTFVFSRLSNVVGSTVWYNRPLCWILGEFYRYILLSEGPCYGWYSYKNL